MLIITKVELELFSDADMYLFFKKGMRDRMSYISNRYSQQVFAIFWSKPRIKTYYVLNASNLCGYVMWLLSTSGFKWIDPIEFDLDKKTSNSSKLCVFKVNLIYPKKLRKLHNDSPLASEKIDVKKEILSKYQVTIDNLYSVPIGTV